jgi:hypothetical protein
MLWRTSAFGEYRAFVSRKMPQASITLKQLLIPDLVLKI